jgi:hypothetical protein
MRSLVHAVLALILLAVTVNGGNEKSPDELYAERLAAAERKVGAKETLKEKTWEQRAKEEREAYQKRHEDALRRESPEARTEREREDAKWAAERAEREAWCAEHPVECAQAEADRQREEARSEAARIKALAEQNYRNDREQNEHKGVDLQPAANALGQVPINAQIVIAPNTGGAAMALLPSEKAALAEYPNLTTAELNSLLPSERARANAARGAAIAAANAAAEAEWCAAHPVECAEEEAARKRAQAQAQAEAAARAEAEDRQQARRLVDQMQTSLLMGHSRDQLKTDLFMANGQAGPKTRQVIDKMQTNLFMGHSKEQLKTDLFMLNP